LSSDIATDLSFDQWLSLGWYVKDFSTQNIHHASIEGKYVRSIQYQDQSVLTVDRTIITELMTQIFGADYGK
jgi:hypothetical protein